MEQNAILIKYVALYLRKSRGENEQDLNKHQKELHDLCLKNNWKFVEYKEIESGDSISGRPIMQKLLSDVEQETYDAVCVVDIDRLGRGDLGDQDKIKKAFLKSNTYVVTPSQIYNLDNENDEFAVDMRSFIARIEYKQIVKRLIRGKKIGSKLGQWTNGSAPFPYEYERWSNKFNEKGLVVNYDKLPIYRFIIDSVVNDSKTTNEIAWELNKRGIQSPRGKNWTNVVIGRMLVDETHLGKIISNKSMGDAHKNKKPSSKDYKKLPREQWNIVENCHEAVKTLEEHEQILIFLSRQCKIPKRGQANIFPLSSLIKCGLCGRTMQIINREDRKNSGSIKPCWYKDSFGVKCGNHGALVKYVYNEIKTAINEQEDILNYKIENSKGFNTDKLQENIKEKTKQISNQNKILEFVYEQFENGTYDSKMFGIRKDKAEKEIERLNNELEILELEIKHYSMADYRDKIEMLKQYKKEIDSDAISPIRLNEIYRTLIESIIFTRKELNGDIDIEIRFK